MYSVLAFTGLRPQKLPFGFDAEHPRYAELTAKIKAHLSALIQKQNIRHVISGMALGSDLLCMEVSVELKRELYPNLLIEAALPCRKQESLWKAEQQQRYKDLLNLCDIIHLCSNRPYFCGCMAIRNQYMVDNADYVYAVWDGTQPGGTQQTIEYARQQSKRIIILNPVNLELRMNYREVTEKDDTNDTQN